MAVYRRVDDDYKNLYEESRKALRIQANIIKEKNKRDNGIKQTNEAFKIFVKKEKRNRI